MIGLKTTPDAAFRSDAVKYAFIGLMRDLRGIAMATNRYLYFVPEMWLAWIQLFIFLFYIFSVVEHMGFFLIGYIQHTCHFS